MQVHLPNIQNKNIIVFDIEYDQGSLVQIAWIMLQQIENSNCLYRLAQSMNLYIQQPKFVSKFFKNVKIFLWSYLRELHTVMSDLQSDAFLIWLR